MQPGVRVWEVQEAPRGLAHRVCEGLPERAGRASALWLGGCSGSPRGEGHGQGRSCTSHQRSSFLPFLRALMGSCLFRSSALGPSSLVCAVPQVPRLSLDLQLGPPLHATHATGGTF